MSNTYTYQDAFESSLEYFNGEEFPANTFVSKYPIRDKDDNFYERTPLDMHKRLAKEFAKIEQRYPNPLSEQKIFDLFDQFKYVIPQGSPMSAIGNPYQIQSSSNCFVIRSPMDSYGGILLTDQEIVQISKRRGGVGVCISSIRPKGAPTNNAAKSTDGIGIFMQRFSNSCEEVAQKGRRGALLLALDIAHPESPLFIKIKRNTKIIEGANISPLISDDFMQAVINNKEFTLQWPVDSTNPKYTKTIQAQELWNDLIESAWGSGEPGALFIDTIRKNSIPDLYGHLDPAFKTICANPCGEIVMGVDSCRLLLINTFSFVKHPFTNNADFDYDHFYDIAIKAQRLADDLVDIEIDLINRILEKIKSDPEPDNIKAIEIDLWKNFKNSCIKGRRTGLGITGIGDTLAALNQQYGCNKSIQTVEQIYRTLALGAHKSSSILAKERGAFPLFDFDIENNSDCPYLKRIWRAEPELKEMSKKYGRRNIALTTTPPAGTVSILAQVSSGIEHIYDLEYTRRRKLNDTQNEKESYTDEKGIKWKEFNVIHPKFKLWKKITGKTKIEDSPYYKSTYKDVDWVGKVKMQAAAQKWVSHSISNTTNLPQHATKELVNEVFMTAYKSGCKGVTIYREGSRKGILVSSDFEDKLNRPAKIQPVQSPKRPEELPCEIYYSTISGKKWIIIIGLLHNEPYELFMGSSDKLNINNIKYGKVIKIKRGIYNLYDNDTLLIEDIIKTAGNDSCGWTTRMMSTSLRHGVPIEYLVEQLSKDGCVIDINNVLARVLRRYIKNRNKRGETCNECGGEIIYIENCKQCTACGWSGCG